MVKAIQDRLVYLKGFAVLASEFERVQGQRLTGFEVSDDWGIGGIELQFEDGTTFRILPDDGCVLEVELRAPSGMNGEYTVKLGHEAGEIGTPEMARIK